MTDIPIDESLFILPPDVAIVPVRSLSPAVRRQIDFADDDFAISRPRMRRPSKVVDARCATLLREFRVPSTIVDAIVRHSRSQHVDAQDTLDQAFAALQAFVAGDILVPADSPAAQTIEASFVAGMFLGEFEILRLIQGLDDSELYEALTRQGTRIAVKVLRPSASAISAELFDQEIAILQHVGGAYVPRLHAAGTNGAVRFLALDWVSGVNIGSAASRLRCAGVANRRRLHELCSRVLAAFADLHARQGVIHGDIHTGNVFVRTDGTICILDFGRSRLASDSPGRIPRGGICYFYEPEMAAALLDNQAPPDTSFAGEQYALAALVYFLLTGHHYQDLSLEQPALLRQVASLSPLAFANRGLSPWPSVEGVLARALQKDPHERFGSVHDFADAFRQARLPRDRGHAGSAMRPDTMIEQLDLSTALFATGVPNAPPHSMAFGSAGLAYLLYRAAMVREDPRLLTLADAWAEHATMAMPMESTAASILHGPAGLHVTRALIACARHDSPAWLASVRAFLNAVRGGEEQSDVLCGSTDAIVAASELIERPLPSAWPTAAAALGDWLAATISGASLKALGGIGDKSAGQLYAVLRACRALSLEVPACVRHALDRLDDASRLTVPGWCDGSAGMLHVWMLAHGLMPLVRRYRENAERCARHAHRHDDGAPDLCRGLSGRALALLGWYQDSGNAIWLDRARTLAQRAVRTAEFAEHPYSLLKGSAGVALLLLELESPERAAMPLWGIDD